jgi:hypothetical protein
VGANGRRGEHAILVNLAMTVRMQLSAKEQALYDGGYLSGFRDGAIVAAPVGVGAYTLTTFRLIEREYMSSVYSFFPTPQQIGYADGFDAAATLWPRAQTR